MKLRKNVLHDRIPDWAGTYISCTGTPELALSDFADSHLPDDHLLTRSAARRRPSRAWRREMRGRKHAIATAVVPKTPSAGAISPVLVARIPAREQTANHVR